MQDALRLIREQLSGRTGRDFWRTLESLSHRPELSRLMPHEPTAERPAAGDVSRRSFLKAFAASVAVSGGAACSASPDEKALPYVEAPGSQPPYEATYYATAVTFAGFAQPVLGKTVAGRPVKLEGNPDHPLTRGATDPFLQAALYGLYDPSRSQAPRLRRRETSWENFEQACIGELSALDRSGGDGFRLLTGQITSPTLIGQVEALRTRWPKLIWHMSEPGAGEAARRRATAAAFGRPLDRQLLLDRAETVLSFDDDFLGSGPHQAVNARRWAESRRRFRDGEADCSLFIAETSPTITGSRAEERIAAAPGRIPVLIAELAKSFGLDAGNDGLELTAEERRWLDAAMAALRVKQGRALITIGDAYPAALQSLVIQLNERLGANGSTIRFSEPVGVAEEDDARSIGSLERLSVDMNAGRVTHLLILGCNPAYASPAALKFGAGLKRVPFAVHAGLHYDETAELCTWHVPVEHELETWSDARAADGTTTILQPLVRPFYDVRSIHRIVSTMAGDPRDGHAIVEKTWRRQWGDAFEDRWQEALLAGFVAGSENAAVSPGLASGFTAPSPEIEAQSDGLVLAVSPDPTIWDGRYSDNGWLQELPKPISKITWGNVFIIGADIASSNDLANGDVIEIETADGSVSGPVWIVPGQAKGTVTATLGYGRRGDERLAAGLGYDAFALLPASGERNLEIVAWRKAGHSETLATTQPHQDMQDYAFVRSHVRGAAPLDEEEAENQPTFYPRREWESPSWGMSIDLDACIGCNACAVACMAENNVPVVGKDLVAQGREMHWLRIDHYFEENGNEPASHFQPVPCMHCEEAPCEMGCPVNATVHTFDGLNMQVYNRCIGTRTCSSFCPYKVRRFNWFDYTGSDPAELQAMRNPDVTVRDRGVMEKCSYCVQRISEARINAKKDGREIEDGEVVTACQQACPTQAISFGDVVDPDTTVSRQKREARHYTLLKEVNTRPRTTYLARVERDRTGEAEG
jgi:Fe-S-cluster-containing dehydrogenase component